MPKNIKTHLYCYDDHRAFSEDVKKRFSDQSRYTVLAFPTSAELIYHLQAEHVHKYCKVAILGLHDSPEQYSIIEELTSEIKKIDPATSLILLGPPDKMEIIQKTLKFNIDAYIPKNANTILRIHNTVKKLISEHSIGIFRRKRNLSLAVLVGFFVLSLILIFLARIKLPLYF